MKMHLLRTLHVRLNPSAIIALSKLSLRACTHQSRCLFLPRYGSQTLAWHGQKLWFHSAPGQDSLQDKKNLNSPAPEKVAPPEKAETLSTTDHATPSAVVEEGDPLQDKSIGLFQRFKKTFQQYGKVMLTVHVLTSSVWLGTFYYAAIKGINVVPFLEFIGLPESIVNILKNSESGNVLTAYALYKGNSLQPKITLRDYFQKTMATSTSLISTPVRYTVTLGGTSISVKYLRKYGYLTTPPLVKDYIQDKMEETKERFTEKIEETKDMFNEKIEETKDRLTEKLQETKDTLSFRKKKEE